MPAPADKRTKWLGQGLAVILGVAIALLLVEVWNRPLVQDTWKGLWYEPDAKVAATRADLALTAAGERIFAATQPTLEDKDAFNEHCESQNREVSLLGCYVNGRIYVYEVLREGLTDSNKVTLAHELLHAAWDRMGKSEKARVSELLEDVRAANAEWFKTELASYNEEAKIEEVWTRAGTKLKDLPEELEQAYAKYFQERARIVAFYESYQAPFQELQKRNEKLQTEILATKAEIVTERANYAASVAELDAEIERFNQCADAAGCFEAREFEQEREKLMAEKARLEQRREEINEKIERNNRKVIEYQENQLALGELVEAMNSQIDNI